MTTGSKTGLSAIAASASGSEHPSDSLIRLVTEYKEKYDFTPTVMRERTHGEDALMHKAKIEERLYDFIDASPAQITQDPNQLFDTLVLALKEDMVFGNNIQLIHDAMDALVTRHPEVANLENLHKIITDPTLQEDGNLDMLPIAKTLAEALKNAKTAPKISPFLDKEPTEWR